MTYTEEVYEQLRGDGSVLYKVCAAVPGKCFFGLINTTERWWLGLCIYDEVATTVFSNEDYGDFYESKEKALSELRKCIDQKEKADLRAKIIHYKRIQP